MAKRKKENKNYSELGILIVLTFLIFILWDTDLIYPIKLFIVLIHEINHALMTIFSGGQVKSINFSLNLTGTTIIQGGNLILISSAGYLGSLLWGVLLYKSAFNQRLRLWISTILAIIILICTTNLINGGIQIFLSLTIFLLLILIPRFLNERFNSFFFKFFGLTSCLYVVVDIKEDLLTTSLRETDTQILEYLTNIPAELIGFIWLIISLVTVVFLIKQTYSNRK